MGRSFAVFLTMVLLSGCGGYFPEKLPGEYIEDHPDSVRLGDVFAFAKIFDCTEAKSTFSCDMCKKGVQPVFIVMDNKSDVTYRFRKANVDSGYIYAEKAAMSCALSHMKGGIWPPAHVRINKINQGIMKDYTAKEIGDGLVEPGQALSGVMFIEPIENGERIDIPLISREDGERLMFQFPPSAISQRDEEHVVPE